MRNHEDWANESTTMGGKTSSACKTNDKSDRQSCTDAGAIYVANRSVPGLPLRSAGSVTPIARADRHYPATACRDTNADAIVAVIVDVTESLTRPEPGENRRMAVTTPRR